MPPLADEIRQTRPFRGPAHEATLSVLRTADVVRRHLTRIVGPAGLTIHQYNVLRILRGAGGAPLSVLDIQNRLLEETPGVNRIIERLVTRKLVRRDRSHTDRRLLECFITEAGLQVLAGLDDDMDRALGELARGLEERQLHGLVDGLQHMRDRALSR